MVSTHFSKTPEKFLADYTALHFRSTFHDRRRGNHKFGVVICYGESTQSSSWVLQVAWFSYSRLWRWRQHIPPKSRYTIVLHAMTFENIVTTVRTLNPIITRM
jgi:hypothetical protein